MTDTRDADFLSDAAEVTPAAGFKARDGQRWLNVADRHRTYVILAALTEAGLDIEEATHAIIDGYAQGKDAAQAEVIGRFFLAMTGKERAELAELARSVFGKSFVGIDEVILLSVLPESVDVTATLRSLAGLTAEDTAKASGSRL